MNENNESLSTRREFIKNTGRFAAASALVGMTIPNVHAAANNTIQVALIGCGGRGAGAADNALNVKKVPMKLVAMADVFEHRLSTAYGALKKSHPATVDVPPERQFIGFDG